MARKVLLTGMFALLIAPLAAQAETSKGIDQVRGEGERRVAVRRSARPTIPVILDGVLFAPGTLPESRTGRTFVITPEDQKNGVVHAFSSAEVAKEFILLQNIKSGSVDSSGTAQQHEESHTCAHPYNFSEFNKVRGGGGSDRLFMDMDQNTWDPEIYFSLPGDWNNTISWVAAACNGWTTALYSCRDFWMNSDYSCADPDNYHVPSGMIIPDLVPYNFNNRTSSIKFGY